MVRRSGDHKKRVSRRKAAPRTKTLPQIAKFAAIVGRLRKECPWDRKQTHQTLEKYLVEEAFEVVDAIRSGKDKDLCEELGDLLLQVVLHAAIAEQAQRFNLEDVARGISEKMVRRHPHVFGDEEFSRERWAELKKAEKKGEERGVFDVVPISFPGLRLGQRYGDVAKELRFDWPDTESVFQKVREEVGEVEEALQDGDRKKIREELGDLFFVLANLARHLDFDADEVASEGARKFRRRYESMAVQAAKEKIDLVAASSETKEQYWADAKKREVTAPRSRGKQRGN